MRYFRNVLIAAMLLGLIGLLGAGTAGAENAVYVVQRGDTLSALARQYGTSVQAIAATNGIANPNRIYVGQTLIIPGAVQTSASVWTTSATSATYVVQPGDTLSSIARRFGVSVQQLAAANGIANLNLIYTGQVLAVQAGAVYVPAYTYTTTVQTTTTSSTSSTVQSSSGALVVTRPAEAQHFSNVEKITIEWTPYPGAYWYRLHIHLITTGELREYLWPSTAQDVYPSSQLFGVGTYHYYIIAYDQAQNELARSAQYSLILDSVIEQPIWSISYWATAYTLNAGECATIHWDVANIDQVYFHLGPGTRIGVPGEYNYQVCHPGAAGTQDYVLEVLLKDGNTETRTLTITFN
jgi:LysM repeat protein